MKQFKFLIDGHRYQTSVNEIANNLAEVTVNGTTFRVEIQKEEAVATPRPTVSKVVSAAQTTTQSAPTGIQVVKSPLPGSIIKVNVKAGDKVNVGDELLTMESMKMENSIKSEFSGIVKAVYVEPGKNVMQEDRMLEIETVAAPQAASQPAQAPKAEAPKAAAPAEPKATSAPASGTKVTSPLPGSIIKILVTEGQAVKKGDTLLSLESMKMENAIMAEQDGIVKQICVTPGQNVMQEDLLLVLG